MCTRTASVVEWSNALYTDRTIMELMGTNMHGEYCIATSHYVHRDCLRGRVVKRIAHWPYNHGANGHKYARRILYCNISLCAQGLPPWPSGQTHCTLTVQSWSLWAHIYMARTVLKRLTVGIRPASVVEWSNALHTDRTIMELMGTHIHGAYCIEASHSGHNASLRGRVVKRIAHWPYNHGANGHTYTWRVLYWSISQWA